MKRITITALVLLTAMGGFSQSYLPVTGGALSGPLSGTSASFTGDLHASDIYSSQWLRNSTPLTGLYHSGTATHFYSHEAGYFTIAGSGTSHGGLRFADTHQGTPKGYAYWSPEGFGLLHSAGGWGLRINPGKTEVQDLLVLGMNSSIANDVKRGINFHDATDEQSYGIYREAGAWHHPYPDLKIAFHTGIKLGAYSGYGGTRFYNNSDMATEIMSVGNGDNNVKIPYDLNVGGSFIGTSAVFNGSVGIGTGSPQGKFDIFSESNTGTNPLLSIRSDFHTPGNYGMIRFGDYTQTSLHQKGAIIYESVSGSARGKFHIALENSDGGGSVALSDSKLTVLSNGSVGIGTTNPDSDSKLTVAGRIHSREVKVTVDAGADFVFHNDYNLKPLAEVAEFISKNKHLPEVASASEMKKEGLDLGEMNIKLLQKVEELTLYLIEKDKEVKDIKQKMSELEAKINKNK